MRITCRCRRERLTRGRWLIFWRVERRGAETIFLTILRVLHQYSVTGRAWGGAHTDCDSPVFAEGGEGDGLGGDAVSDRFCGVAEEPD